MPQKFSADSSSTPNSTSASVRSRSSTQTTDAERVSLRLGSVTWSCIPFSSHSNTRILAPCLLTISVSPAAVTPWPRLLTPETMRGMRTRTRVERRCFSLAPRANPFVGVRSGIPKPDGWRESSQPRARRQGGSSVQLDDVLVVEHVVALDALAVEPGPAPEAGGREIEMGRKRTNTPPQHKQHPPL